MIRRPAIAVSNTIIADLISAPASVLSPRLLSFDDRFAAAVPQSVEPAAPAEAPKLVEAPKLNSPETVDRADSSDEPFGLSTATVTQGAVLEKWLSIKREVGDERLVLRLCEENRASCQSRAALEFLAIVESWRVARGSVRSTARSI